MLANDGRRYHRRRRIRAFKLPSTTAASCSSALRVPSGGGGTTANADGAAIEGGTNFATERRESGRDVGMRALDARRQFATMFHY